MRQMRSLAHAFALFTLLLVAAHPAAAESVAVTALGGAGVARAGGLDALTQNPAGAKGVAARTAHLAFHLVSGVDGAQATFAYAEPDSGKGAGILGLIRWSRATGIDPLNMTLITDSGNAWTYVVAKELASSSSVGLRLVYDLARSESRNASGTGYRIDAGLIQSIGRGLSLGIRVDNLLNTGIRWSDGSSTPYPRTLAAGLTYVRGPFEISADAEGSPEGGLLALRAGGRVEWGPVGLLAGVVSPVGGGAAAFSAGASYAAGPWRIEYSFAEAASLHRAGVTWSF